MSVGRVTIDATCLGRRKTGNETYMRGLLGGLARQAPNDLELTALGSAKVDDRPAENVRWQSLAPSNFLTRNFWSIPRHLRATDAGLYHAVYWVSPLLRIPTVVTVHDVSFVRHPEWFRPGESLVYRTLIRQASERARRVITVSEFSRDEICEVFPLDPARVVVTPNGAEPLPDDLPARDEAAVEAGGYFMAVGNLHPRKNLTRLVEAFSRVAEKFHTARLLVVGQPAWLYDSVFAAARDSRVGDRIDFTGYVTRRRLLELYRGAVGLVYPSLYEGFGLPIVEAMQTGCPVVASDLRVFREVAAGAALYVDSRDPDALAEAMERLLTARDLRSNLSIVGEKQATRWSWDETARRTLEVYRSALAE